MGRTVVFTVSLDGQDLAIDTLNRHSFRDALVAAATDRRWRLAALACLVLPSLAAAATLAVTRGPWASTAMLLAAAAVTPCAASWAAARPPTGTRRERVAALLAAGASGLALSLASVPVIAVASWLEGWGESGAVPTLCVLALAGAAGAWVGLAVAGLRRPWSARVAAGVALALVVLPCALAAALMPRTVATDAIVYHRFVPTSVQGRPAFVCGDETVTVSRRHTETVAWLALASPLAWVIDAPAFSAVELADAADGTVAKAQAWTRSTRVGPDDFVGHCYQATSLGTPVAVRLERYEKAGPVGARVAAASALLCGVLALISRRRSA